MTEKTLNFLDIYQPLPHQNDVHCATQTTKALMGGYGSGKTTMLAIEALKLSAINSGYPVGFFGPTHGIVQTVDLPKVEGFLDDMGIEYNYHGTKKHLTIPLWNGKIWFFSCHDPNSLKGPTLASAICDEPGLFPQEAWQIIDSRVRESKAKLLQIVFGGTPEGMNWLFDLLITKANDNTFVRFASTRDNTILPPDRVDSMYANFPARVAKMYLDGQFVPLAEAQVYFAYNPEKHDNKKLVLQHNVPLHIGIDFNVRNMSAQINQIIRQDVLHPLEVSAYETKELAENVYSDVKGYLPWHLYPDASGQYADSKGFSDFQILKDVFNSKGLVQGKHYFMHYPAANGSVRDRTNAVNCLMENALGESHYQMNPDKCPKAKRDWLQVSYKKNSREIDKITNANLTHPSDAEGYMAVRTFPVRPSWR